MNLPDRTVRLTQVIAWAFVFIVAFLIFQPLRVAHGAEKGGTVFTDKNDFFAFVPPEKWTKKDYPNDPRSKVEFSHPTVQGALVRLIAAAASPHMNAENFVALMRQDMETLRTRMGPQAVKMELKEATFGGYPAAFVRQSSPGLEQELTLFLAGNVFFNIAYSAPDTGTFEKHRDVVTRSLNTILVRQAASGSQVQAQRVARYLRLAQLLSEAGNFEIARRYLEDGLQEYPTDARLQKALEMVKQNKKVPEGPLD